MDKLSEQKVNNTTIQFLQSELSNIREDRLLLQKSLLGSTENTANAQQKIMANLESSLDLKL